MGQSGRTSIDMVCHVESKSLCPSNRLAIPAFPLQGSSLRNGVKFSVHTTSRGKVPWSKCRFEVLMLPWSPKGSKVITGRVVRVESMKFMEAQKSPARALLSVIHREKALWLQLDFITIAKASAILTHLPCLPLAKPIFLHPFHPLLRRPMAGCPSSQRPIGQY